MDAYVSCIINTINSPAKKCPAVAQTSGEIHEPSAWLSLSHHPFRQDIEIIMKASVMVISKSN
jgi:hypothetical protein